MKTREMQKIQRRLELLGCFKCAEYLEMFNGAVFSTETCGIEMRRS